MGLKMPYFSFTFITTAAYFGQFIPSRLRGNVVPDE